MLYCKATFFCAVLFMLITQVRCWWHEFLSRYCIVMLIKIAYYALQLFHIGTHIGIHVLFYIFFQDLPVCPSSSHRVSLIPRPIMIGIPLHSVPLPTNQSRSFLQLLPPNPSGDLVPSCACVVGQRITRLPIAHKERTFSFDATRFILSLPF